MAVKILYNHVVRAFGHDTAPGLVLISAAVLAMVIMNTALSTGYGALLGTTITVAFGEYGIAKPLLLWINDFLMAIFFLLVGLEIKREVVTGNLSNIRAASLPLVAAIGGMLVPALIYVFFNSGDPDALRGWAIPAATDIAFALGVLALLGKRVPITLKVFLLAVAIIDDLGAIMIIAIFYTADLSALALVVGAAVTVGLVALNRFGVKSITPYMLLGLVLWIAVLKSGVHATLAGVVVAFCIPIQGEDPDEDGPLLHLEHALVPWVSFGIMPIFALANAGVSLAGMTPAALLEPISIGISTGLFVGKQVGIFGFTFIAVMIGLCRLPSGVSWMQIWGVSLLAAIGFTMSLFIGNLAFTSPEHAAAVRVGVLSGSILAGISGYIILRLCSRGAALRAEKMANAKA